MAYSQLVPKVNSYPIYIVPTVNSYPSQLVPTVKSYPSHVVPKVSSYPSTKETQRNVVIYVKWPMLTKNAIYSVTVTETVKYRKTEK